MKQVIVTLQSDILHAIGIWAVLVITGLFSLLLFKSKALSRGLPAGVARVDDSVRERLAQQARELKRYSQEVTVAAERAAAMAQRRREEWLAAQAQLDEAWAAFEASDAEARRLDSAAALPTPHTPRTPSEYAYRERFLHRAAMAACSRKQLSPLDLSDALAHRKGWDPKRHPADQEVVLRRAVRDCMWASYRAAANRERTAWHSADLANEAKISLREEARIAKARATQAATGKPLALVGQRIRPSGTSGPASPVRLSPALVNQARLSPARIGAARAGAARVGAARIGAARIGAARIGAAQIGAVGISPAWISPAGISPAQISPAGISPAQISPAGIRPAWISPARLGAVRNSPAGIRPSLVDQARIDPMRVSPAGVRPALVDQARIDPMRVSPAGAGLEGISPADISPAEISPAEISPAEISPAGTDPAGVSSTPANPVRVSPARVYSGAARAGGDTMVMPRLKPAATTVGDTMVLPRIKPAAARAASLKPGPSIGDTMVLPIIKKSYATTVLPQSA